MALSNRIKHVLQCICLFSWIFIFCYASGGLRLAEDPALASLDPWAQYGTPLTFILILLR